MEPGENKDRVIVFFKIRPDVITPDNMLTNIVVSSMVESPLNTLYHSMQKVGTDNCLKLYMKYIDKKIQVLNARTKCFEIRSKGFVSIKL